MSYKKRTEEELRAILGEPNEVEGIGFVRCYNSDNRWFIFKIIFKISSGIITSSCNNSIKTL